MFGLLGRFGYGFLYGFLDGVSTGVVVVTIDFQAHLVVHPLVAGEGSEGGSFEGLGKYLVAKQHRDELLLLNIFEKIKPLVKAGREFSFRFVEVGHFQVDVSQLLVKCGPVLVLELDGVHHFARAGRGRVVEDEIEDADAVHGFQLEIPQSGLTLFADGKGRIENRAVFEIILLGLLQFHDELLTFFVAAVHVEHGLTVGGSAAGAFRILEG